MRKPFTGPSAATIGCFRLVSIPTGRRPRTLPIQCFRPQERSSGAMFHPTPKPWNCPSSGGMTASSGGNSGSGRERAQHWPIRKCAAAGHPCRMRCSGNMKKTVSALPRARGICTRSLFAEFGIEPLPVYREPAGSPEGDLKMAQDFPLIRIATIRFVPFYRSEYRQVPSDIQAQPGPATDIPPERARAPGMQQGDWTWIETKGGKIKRRAHRTDRVHPAVARARYGWRFLGKPAPEPSLHGVWESNVNALSPVDAECCNPEAGGWPHTGLLCGASRAD